MPGILFFLLWSHASRTENSRILNADRPSRQPSPPEPYSSMSSPSLVELKAILRLAGPLIA
ncbi:hypothetical protein, partial [Salmonella sp. E393-2]|uniref:hypothetical protein n=1 Tax=Salmonella sp. E393-2 TaxID=3240324 RepID=UPI003529DE45